jgi:hypothetical protein
VHLAVLKFTGWIEVQRWPSPDRWSVTYQLTKGQDLSPGLLRVLQFLERYYADGEWQRVGDEWVWTRPDAGQSGSRTPPVRPQDTPCPGAGHKEVLEDVLEEVPMHGNGGGPLESKSGDEGNRGRSLAGTPSAPPQTRTKIATVEKFAPPSRNYEHGRVWFTDGSTFPVSEYTDHGRFVPGKRLKLTIHNGFVIDALSAPE